MDTLLTEISKDDYVKKSLRNRDCFGSLATQFNQKEESMRTLLLSLLLVSSLASPAELVWQYDATSTLTEDWNDGTALGVPQQFGTEEGCLELLRWIVKFQLLSGFEQIHPMIIGFDGKAIWRWNIRQPLSYRNDYWESHTCREVTL